MAPDRRMLTRYGNAYAYSRFINDFFEKKGNKSQSLILLPPTAYFKKNGFDFHVPEPAVFYYYTGLKTVWANSPQAMKANWYVRATGGKIVIDSVTGTGSLSDTIAGFKKFEIKL